ncbi:hypothetical protein B0H14DRAFT_3650281 [Mycena olivaceomarginata]|nr:hypothetical protein B0H14DRAFT_3650281 [Mycena olivaceomarginata]
MVRAVRKVREYTGKWDAKAALAQHVNVNPVAGGRASELTSEEVGFMYAETWQVRWWSEPRATVAIDQVNAQFGDPWLLRRSSTPQRVVDVDPRPTPARDHQRTAKEQGLARHAEPRCPKRGKCGGGASIELSWRSGQCAVRGSMVNEAELDTAASRRRGSVTDARPRGRSTPSLPKRRTEGAVVGEVRRDAARDEGGEAEAGGGQRLVDTGDDIERAMLEAEVEGVGMTQRPKAGDTRAGAAAMLWEQDSGPRSRKRRWERHTR